MVVVVGAQTGIYRMVVIQMMTNNLKREHMIPFKVRMPSLPIFLSIEGTATTLSVYRSRYEALPSIDPAIFAEQMVKRSNNATENGHICVRGFADDCHRLGCDL